MYYQYEIFTEPNKPCTIADLAAVLEKFDVIEKTDEKVTLLFADWKIYIELTEGEEVTEMAYDHARYHLKPAIAKSSQRIAVSTDDDEDGSHEQDHLNVMEALAGLDGAHIYSAAQDKFLFGEEPLRPDLSDLRLEFLDELEEDLDYVGLVQDLRDNPYDVNSWELLEEMMEEAGELDFQLDCLHNLMTLCPWDYVPFFNTGILHRDMDEYEKAEVYFRKTTELEPDFSDAWADLAKLSFMKNKTEDGLRYTDKAIELKLDNYIPYVNAGYYLIKLGDPEKSITYSEPGMEYDPYCCTFNKAHALLALGKNEEAIAFYKESLQAADSKQEFRSDFKADFVIFKKYGITKESYEALLPKIIN